MDNCLFVYSWTCDDEQDDRTIIRCYGIDPNGYNVVLWIEGFQPSIYIEIPEESGNLIDEIIRTIKRNVTKITIEENKHHLYSDRPARFIRCQCATRKRIFYVRYALKNYIKTKYELKVHEECANTILQFVAARRLPTATWLSFDSAVPITRRKRTSCDKEFSVDWCNVYPSSKRSGLVNPKIVAFDLEVNSEIHTAMPADRPDDVIFQISCVDNNHRKILLTLDGTGDTEEDERRYLVDIEVRRFVSEEKLLIGFIDLLRSERPNVLIGYNILGFDISYLVKRCDRYALIEELSLAGFNTSKPAQQRSIKWSSSAYRNQEFNFVDWEGILIVDLLPIIKRDYKFDNYKLDTVATSLIGAEKDPVGYKEIFAAYASKKMARVGKYCVQDSYLCIGIFEKIHCWEYLSEMAAICKVTMFEVYTKGQQWKTYCRIYDYCVQRGDLVVTSNGYSSEQGERYTGAFVLDPKPGLYENVVPLDFASMYPNIIIAYNICYSTFVPSSMVGTVVPKEQLNEFVWEDHVGCEHDPKVIATMELTNRINAIEERVRKLMMNRKVAKGKEAKRLIQLRINSLRDQQKPLREERAKTKPSKNKPQRRRHDYRREDYPDDDEDNDDGIFMCAKRNYFFYLPRYRSGVVPMILKEILDSRKRIKREMTETNDPRDRIVLDKKQLAYKVLANSQYGGMGVQRGYLPFMPGAMCVTYKGRELIKHAGIVAKERYGADWIYTDTDSTYVIFRQLGNDTKLIWDHALQVAKGISNEFPSGVDIEFENVIYANFLILTKKKYMYRSIDRDGNCDKEKIGKRGCVIARRDNSVLLRNTYEKTVSMIFDGCSANDVTSFLIEYINDIYRNVLPYEFYVVTKSIRSTGDDEEDIDEEGMLGDYKVKRLPTDETERSKILEGFVDERSYFVSCCPGQVQLAERMKRRGCPVDAGSRIEFVVLNRPEIKTIGGRMEEYDYFSKRTKHLRLDKEYYVRSLINPIDELLYVTFGTKGFVANQLKYRKKYTEVLKNMRKTFLVNRFKIVL